MKRIDVCTVKMVKESSKLYNIHTKKASSPDAVNEAIREIFALHESAVEKFGIFTLNTKNEIMGAHIIHVGGINASIVDIRSILQRCLLNNATAFICFHNHPSGNPEPSNEDIKITQTLYKAGELLKIELFDHVIIGEDNYVSLKNDGHF